MRTGKIARLPRDIRTELNRRLRDGHCGRQLVDWLNALPEVQAALQREFDGRPIYEPNLTEWKQGGYREWETQQEALARSGDLAADAEEIAHATQGRLADHLATILAARYAAELAAWTGEDADGLRLRLRSLRELCHHVVELQRGQQNAARLKIEQARLDRDREKIEEEVTGTFLRWIAYPQVRDCACDDTTNLKEKKARLLEIFRSKPDQLETPEEDSLFVHEVHPDDPDPDPDEPPALTDHPQPLTDTEN